jgi:hypothetical protein
MKKQFVKQLGRRMMSESGWVYFCRICNNWRPAEDFYKKKDTPYGIDSRCKIHLSRKDKDDDGMMDYFRLDALTEDDFTNTQKVLEGLGYEFNTNKTVHQQFCEKYDLTFSG